MNPILYETFKKGSKTYFNSALFFPRHVREDVFTLYAFVRVADDYVDQTPPDTESFLHFVDLYHYAMRHGPSGDIVIDSFVNLAHRLDFEPAWTEAFLHSMRLDTHKTEYQSMDELLEYIYGSAEVIGLYMARIMGLPEASWPYAQMQGRAMQLINFIRDVQEDLALGRVYLPLAGHQKDLLRKSNALGNPGAFRDFITEMLTYYYDWQQEAEKGYAYIPGRYLVPIKTAAQMYGWTAQVIAKDPLVVLRTQVKPSRARIFARVLLNMFPALLSGREFLGKSPNNR